MADITAPGRLLHTRFIALGDMTGKTSQEIIARVGPPTSMSAMADGGKLLQWQATGCHMALKFGPDGRMMGITHEYAKYEKTQGGCATTIVVLTGIVVFIAIMLITCLH